MKSTNIKSLKNVIGKQLKHNPSQWGIALFLVLAVVVVVLGSFVSTGNEIRLSYANEINESDAIEESTTLDADDVPLSVVYVYICGAVNQPGVYAVQPSARICDVIECAGGSLGSADLTQLNLALTVQNEQMIYVPEFGEVNTVNGAAVVADAANGKVNINTASASQLESLNGIGPSLAARIVDYRTANGFFKSIDELKNVSGIGDKKFESVRDFVCV